MNDGRQISIQLVPGNVAPRYTDKTKQLHVKKAVITEQGILSGLPIVDFLMVDEDGNEYFFMTTGRLVNELSAAVKGVNLRNHGVEEP